VTGPTDLLSELAAWRPRTADQVALHADLCQYVQAHPDAWSRDCRPDHVTASAIVLNRTGTHVLLALHGKVGRWLQFGGHVEPQDRNLHAAALRETVEESGLAGLRLAATEPLRLDRHAAPCGARHHLDVQYLVVVDEIRRPTPTAESTDVTWFPVHELPDGCDSSVRALLADALASEALRLAGPATA
jgi:8-oxo-dGTP pyrophosphatase MutT (NUDIX family)